MDDATQKLGTCPTCRHAEHEGHICLNMASDYDCGCDKRTAKVADDATQKLVDRVKDYPTITRLSHKTQIELIEQLRDALEAAQRPPVAEPDNHHNADVCPFCTRNRDEREAAIRAEALTQRPPVSPEQREALIEALLKVPGNERGPAHGEPGFWPYFSDDEEDRRDAGRFVDAILARFSLPVLDVEKVAEAAQAEVNQAHPEWHDVGVGIVQGSHYRAGFVAGAKWAVASLHTLTTDGTPADTERNES